MKITPILLLLGCFIFISCKNPVAPDEITTVREKLGGSFSICIFYESGIDV